MSVALQGLRAEVEAAVLAEVERVGPKFIRADMVRRFQGLGASARTLQYWVARVVDSGKAGQHLAARMKEDAAQRAERAADAAEELAREVAAKLPVVVTPEEIAGTGTIAVMDRLRDCVRTALDVMAYARTADGKVRNAKLLVSASDHLRKSLETSVRLYEAVQEISQVDAFHAAIIDEIRKESHELAERVLQRMRQLNASWGPQL